MFDTNTHYSWNGWSLTPFYIYSTVTIYCNRHYHIFHFKYARSLIRVLSLVCGARPTAMFHHWLPCARELHSARFDFNRKFYAGSKIKILNIKNKNMTHLRLFCLRWSVVRVFKSRRGKLFYYYHYVTHCVYKKKDHR